MTWVALATLSPISSPLLDSLVLGRAWRDCLLEKLVSQEVSPLDRVLYKKLYERSAHPPLVVVLAQSPGSVGHLKSALVM